MSGDHFNFTKTALEALPVPPAGRRKYYYDTKVRGLAMCVMASGNRTFYVYRRMAGKPQRVHIGPFPDLSVEQARRKAEAVNTAIAHGHDPSFERAATQAEWTFDALFAWYIEDHAKLRKRSWNRDVQNYENHLAHRLGALPISKVSRPLVRELHARVREQSGLYAANRVLALVSVVYSKAIAHEKYLASNPASGIEMYQEESRDRRLSAAEIPRLMAALEAEPNATLRDYIYMLLFTGARRQNVLAMRWDEIDCDSRVWRIPITKNGKPQFVPLEEPEIEVLRRRQEQAKSPWVFPGRSDGSSGHLAKPDHGWKRILDRAGIGDLRIHDLRRTLGSWMVDTGASLPVIGQTLHHRSQATTAVYARMSMDPVRSAKSRALAAMLEASERDRGT